ncbi:MAG: DUF222 domain-containing protein [Acidimicrobiales bacterium]|nr:HNH endonuclease [Actinomycetota bacterium]
MFVSVESAAEWLREAVAALEPGCFSGEQASALVDAFAKIERLGAAGRTLMARRVEETNLWRRQGQRSAAHWMAAKTGSSVGAAAGALATARRLEALPATAEAYRAGELSELQASEIVSAAAVDPGAEQALLASAGTDGVAGLRERCRAVRAAAADDEVARHRALHRSRRLRHWCDADGAFRMDLRTTPDAGAVVLAALEPHRCRIVAEARAAGRREPAEAYAADALVGACEASGPTGGGKPGPRAMVHVRVDHSALVRGHLEAGETCDIPGVGPIPVAAAKAMLGDAVLKAIVTKGVEVTAAAHGGRTVTAHQRTALEVRDPECVVGGCHVRDHLEIDHVDGWALTRITTVDRLARLCRFHHHLKTYCGYRLDGGPGAWTWVAPDDEYGGAEPSRPPPGGLSQETRLALTGSAKGS